MMTLNKAEKAIQESCVAFLQSKGAMTWRMDGGKWLNVPDIFALLDGTLYGLEIKRTKGRLTLGQMEMLCQLVHHGAVAGVVKSVEQVKEVLDRTVRNKATGLPLNGTIYIGTWMVLSHVESVLATSRIIDEKTKPERSDEDGTERTQDS